MRDRFGQETADPLEDRDAACECDGSGWTSPGKAEADRRHPYPLTPALEADAEELAAYEQRCRAVERKRHDELNSYYPCPSCRPTLHERWRGGHWSADHNRTRCEDCQPGRKVKA